MVSDTGASAVSVGLRLPIMVMVTTATAMPIELRPFDLTSLSTAVYGADVVANVAGYVPVGVVLARMGVLPAWLVALAMTVLIEAMQLGMMHRDPSMVDVVANAVGAGLGIAVARGRRLRSPSFAVSRPRAAVAGALACGLLFAAWTTSAYPVNARGTTSPGTLEAHWTFDEEGALAPDSSGHGLSGRLHGRPARVAGMVGRAIRLDGSADYVDFGRSTPLRLGGSMTISAWINASAFPLDDAAIVSNHNGLGYQLDTTVDTGPRTIGFKLANACGVLMARYGVTPLSPDVWYHVAGVYDGEQGTLDVYLNGRLDNGFLRGWVTPTQRSSREVVYVGRRSNRKGFEFAGSIDDVRVYSRALTRTEIPTDMHGQADHGPTDHASTGEYATVRQSAPRRSLCGGQSDREDALLPSMSVVVGALAGYVCLAFWPAGGWLHGVFVGLGVGLFWLTGPAAVLPALGRWLIPLATVLGCVSVVGSRIVGPMPAGDESS